MEGKELTVKTLLIETKEVTDWKQLGIHLDIDIAILEAIKAKNASIQDSKADVYIHWLRNDPKASWEKLCAALQHIEHGVLAQKLLPVPDSEGGAKMLEAASNATPGDYSSNAETKEGRAMKVDVLENVYIKSGEHPSELTDDKKYELTEKIRALEDEFSVLPSQVELEVKFDLPSFTPAQLDDFRKKMAERFLSSLSECTASVYYKKVKNGCFVATWLLPQELAKTLEDACRKEKSDFFYEYHVIFLSINGRRIYEDKEKLAQTESSWELTVRGEKRYEAYGPRDVLIIVSSESLEGPNIVPRKKGSLTQQDKDRLTSEGIPPECWQDDAKLTKARCLKDKMFDSVEIERNSEVKVGYIKDKIATFFDNTTTHGVVIHYIGPGKKDTGDWCFKDGFVTFEDIVTLYTRHFTGRVMTISCDCSYSGQWVEACKSFLDTVGIKPCGHSARKTGMLLKAFASCQPHQIGSSLLCSARGCGNDKKSGAGTVYSGKKIAPDQTVSGEDFTRITCDKLWDEECALSPDFTFHMQKVTNRIYLVRGSDKGRKRWDYLLLLILITQT